MVTEREQGRKRRQYLGVPKEERKRLLEEDTGAVEAWPHQEFLRMGKQFEVVRHLACSRKSNIEVSYRLKAVIRRSTTTSATYHATRGANDDDKLVSI